MPDIITALTIISTVATLVGACFTYLALRRTPKPPKLPITPSCTTILGANMMDRHIEHLPTYHPGMSRMGFGRIGNNG